MSPPAESRLSPPALLEETHAAPGSGAQTAFRIGEEREQLLKEAQPFLLRRPLDHRADVHRAPSVRCEELRTFLWTEPKRGARLLEEVADLLHDHSPKTRRHEVENPPPKARGRREVVRKARRLLGGEVDHEALGHDQGVPALPAHLGE